MPLWRLFSDTCEKGREQDNNWIRLENPDRSLSSCSSIHFSHDVSSLSWYRRVTFLCYLANGRCFMLQNALGWARFPELAGGKINLWTKVYVISCVEYFYRVPGTWSRPCIMRRLQQSFSIAFAAYHFYTSWIYGSHFSYSLQDAANFVLCVAFFL